ncbi:hypothetical protein MNV49_002823 [Pseudohyphozyma bogoriensis]|nr:hypothetical protein MNV49_002823 [Pseudohyphozyma bogoriensis]
MQSQPKKRPWAITRARPQSTTTIPTLPLDAVRSIFDALPISEQRRSAIVLGSVCRSWRALFLPIVFSKLVLDGRDKDVVGFERLLRRNGALGRGVRELVVAFDDIYSTLSTPTSRRALHHVFGSVPSLTSLSITITPLHTPSPLNYILPPSTSLHLSHPKRLTTLSLSHEIWSTDLWTLLSSFPFLKHLTLSTLRSDCCTKLGVLTSPILTHLEIATNTLPSSHVFALLSLQTSLTHLEMHLPSNDALILAALKPLARTIQHLRLKNRFTKSSPLETTPFIPLLKAATNLVELELDSHVFPPLSILSIAALDSMNGVTKIWLDESGGTRAREELGEALETGHLEALEEVVSFNVKKSAGKGKRFERMCEVRDVIWTVE